MQQKVCRLCLITPPVYFSLLESNIAPMFEALTFSKVDSTDEISTIVCLKCLLNLKLAYSFQQKIKISERKLLERVKIKQENDASQNVQTCQDLVNLCNKNCLICGISVGDDLMNDHIREHFSNEQKCSSCNETFPDIQLCREHLLEHPERTIHECKKCKARFQYKTFYDLHIRTGSCVTKETIEQRITALGLSTKQAISKLKRTKGCKTLNVQDTNIKERVHKLGLHSSQAIKVLIKQKTEAAKERRVCNICFKSFTKKSFQCHTHVIKTCEICNRQISKQTFNKHMKEHALGPQICHLCGASLLNPTCLKAHIFYSHNERRYKCDECEKVFRKKNLRDLHVQKEHIGKPTHFCEKCGKGFYSGRFLTKHIKMKHLKLRPYICGFCERGFSSQHALKTHRRQHTNETPYKCEVCGDGFKQKVSLRAHRKSKHDIVEENICNCKVCGRGFASDAALYAHMRLH